MTKPLQQCAASWKQLRKFRSWPRPWGADGKARTVAPTRKPKRGAAKDAAAPALAPQEIDPDHLIAQFTTEVRSSGLDVARQIGAGYRPRLIERLHEVIDEIGLEAERWAKDPLQHDEPPGNPHFCAALCR